MSALGTKLAMSSPARLIVPVPVLPKLSFQLNCAVLPLTLQDRIFIEHLIDLDESNMVFSSARAAFLGEVLPIAVSVKSAVELVSNRSLRARPRELFPLPFSP